jgi:hypothetical protein
MTRFSIAGYWANAHFSADDQARFFNRIDRLIPKASRAYARGLLSSIVSYQRWGFSRYAAAAGFRTFFKGGWRGTGAGQLVHEAALFERRDTRVSMAVLTDGNPSHEYGTETLRGVAERVFARRPRSARRAAGANAAAPRRRPARPSPRATARRVAPGSSTSTASPPASESSSTTSASTTSPVTACPAIARTGRSSTDPPP